MSESLGRESLTEARVQTVYCTQFAACRWQGKRLVERLGVQPKPCPKCGKDVTA